MNDNHTPSDFTVASKTLSRDCSGVSEDNTGFKSRTGTGRRSSLGSWFCVYLLYQISVIIFLASFTSFVPAVEASESSYSSVNNWYKHKEEDVVKYLGKFGYLTDASQETGPAGLTSKEVYVSALKRLQRWGHIPETGVIDKRTADLMMKPRCGVRDDVEPSFLNKRRRKRYVTANSKWEKSDLTFRILNSTPDMSANRVRRIIHDAFKVWSDVSPLTFTEVQHSHPKDADILIMFAEGYHHDGFNFDGKGSVLAHAFFPGEDRGGDTHFDDAETWTFNSTEGVDLFMVAAHEFGHALGLAHSSNTDALMYPWYQGYEEGFKLPYDDVQGIQTLYGSKNSKFTPQRTPRPPVVDADEPRPQPPTKRPDTRSNPCLGDIDAITVIRKEVFIFSKDLFWRLGTNGIHGAPTKINMFWHNIPDGGIDAVYERTDGKIVFFKGNRFWVFSGNFLVSNFPKDGRRISELGIDRDVEKIDAVFIWGYNKRTYLVTNDMYWKLSDDDEYIEYDYPRDMGIWKGVPLPIDSAFQHWDGKTYFLKGDEYWTFYDTKMRTKKKTGSPVSRLFGCKNGVLDNAVVAALLVPEPKKLGREEDEYGEEIGYQSDISGVPDTGNGCASLSTLLWTLSLVTLLFR